MPKYTEQDIQNAILDVLGGLGIRPTCRAHGVPRSTLQHRLKGVGTRSEGREQFQRLSAIQETHLVSWVLAQAALGLPITHQQLPLD